MIFYDSKDKRKKYVRTFFVLGALVIFGIIISLSANLFFAFKKETGVSNNIDIAKLHRYYFTPLNKNKISLTFDDGPHPIHTEKVISILQKHEVPATFFFVGENVLKNPRVAERVSDLGYEIGNHTFTHSEGVHLTPQRLQNELRTTKKIIEASTGRTPLFYRPPFLLDIGPDPTINPEVAPNEALQVAFNEGYIPVGADIDSKDWVAGDPEQLLQNVLKAAPNGHIILLHDGGLKDAEYMLEVLDEMITTLKSDGYEFVSLRELLTPPSVISLTQSFGGGQTDLTTNGEVSLLQWFLYSEKFLDPYSISGKFDENTKIALENWQLERKVVEPDDLSNPEYGRVGPKTRELIGASYGVGEVLGATTEKTFLSSINSKLQHTNLELVSFLMSSLKYLFWIIIALIIFRIVMILGLAIFLFFKNKFVKTKTYSYKKGVTVLVPAYNEEENIESSILSIIQNDYPEKEILVINDGSTDGTRLVVENMQLKYPDQIKLLNIPNGGKYNALNIGVDNAKYDVFVAMDGDTIFAKDTISHLVKHFGNPKVGAVAGKVETTCSFNVLDIFQTIEYEVGQNIEKRVFAGVNAVGVIPGPVGAWRKSVVMKCGGYSNETLVEDQDLTLGILTSGYKILYEPKAIAYTETPHTLKDFLKQRFRWIFGTLQCTWKYRRYLIKKPLSPFSLVVLPNTILFSLIVPLFYPVVDAILIIAMILGAWKEVVLTYVIFTIIDVLYSSAAFIGKRNVWWRLLFIPIQRLYYRQFIYYVVAKSILRAFEGGEEAWGKVKKNGDSQKYYFRQLEERTILNIDTP